MNTREENKQLSDLATQVYLDQNTEITSTLPEFSGEYADFVQNMTAKGVVIGKLAEDKRGVAEGKGNLREKAVEKGLLLSKKLVAFAKRNRNAILAKEASVPRLIRLPDIELHGKLIALRVLGEAHKEEAAAFGVNAALLTEVETTTGAYFDAIPMPRLSISDKKALNKDLKDLQKKCDENLEVIDAIVDTVKDEQASFHAEYFNVRKIIDSGKRHLAVIIQVNEAGSGAGIKSVKLEISGQAEPGTKEGTDLTKTVKRTSDMGGCRIKGLQNGTYTLKASKVGYAVQTATMYVNEGELTRVMMELSKN